MLDITMQFNISLTFQVKKKYEFENLFIFLSDKQIFNVN